MTLHIRSMRWNNTTDTINQMKRFNVRALEKIEWGQMRQIFYTTNEKTPPRGATVMYHDTYKHQEAVEGQFRKMRLRMTTTAHNTKIRGGINTIQ